MKQLSKKFNGEQGFTLVETLIALIITMFLLPVLFEWVQVGLTTIKKRNAADHLSMVNRAAAVYVQKHHERLITEASPIGGPVLDVPTLITEEMLPQRFNAKNVWRQEYRVYIREPRQGELQAITLTTGGQGHEARDVTFGTVIIPSAATLLGGAGGFVPTGDVPGQSAGTLHGSFGGWIVDLAALGIPSPGAGHLGALASFDKASLAQDFLYRVAVPGHKELNAMQTELDMTDHAIRGVSELQFTARDFSTESCADPLTDEQIFLDTTHGLYLCRNGRMETIGDTGNSQFMQEMLVVENGTTITKPICPVGSGTVPNIFVAPSIAAAGAEAPPMVALQAWAESVSDTQWQVRLRLLTTDDTLGWIYPTPNYGRVAVFTACTKERVTP